MSSKFLSLFGLCLVSRVLAQDLGQLALPWKAHLENAASECLVASPTELRLVAPAQTDLFISPDGGYRTDKSPRVVFHPEGPFILTARIRPEFRGKWDAGVLLLYNDPEHYAKFCFEQDFQGVPRIVSVVCNERGDDCNSAPVREASVYYRIVGSSLRDTFGFYVSQDGLSWFPVRTFRLLRTDKLQVGFSAQSPAGAGCSVQFSDIHVQCREVKDEWKGD